MATDSTYPRAGDRTPAARAQREEYWRRMLARQRQSGLTRAEFCRREGLQESAISWWAKELAERDRPAKTAVTPKPRPKKKTPRTTFVPLQMAQAASIPSAFAFEIVTRSGHVVRLGPGFDPEMLRRAIAALEGTL